MSEWLGKTVKHNVLNDHGLLVLQSGTVLTEKSLLLLENHRIDPSELTFAEAAVPSFAGNSPYDRLFRETIQSSEELFDYTKRTRQVPIAEFQKLVIPGIHEVSQNPDLFQLLQDIRGKDAYTYEHNIAVGVMANMIGNWLRLPEPDIQHLALAATLHDVGKVNIPDVVLHKPGRLTSDEYKLIQKHTIFGYEILKNTEGTSHRTALVALQHHEREDGKGYPFGVRGAKIDFFAKIVAIVDIFHAMSSRRPYHEPLPFQQVVDRMKSGSFGELQPNIVHLFMRRLSTSIIGNQVKLSDGRIGEVIFIHPNEDELKPIVKVDSAFVDLKITRNLHIVDVFGAQASAKLNLYETEAGTWFSEDELMEAIDWFVECAPEFNGLNGRQVSFLRQLLLDYILCSPTRDIPQMLLEWMPYEKRLELMATLKLEKLQDYAG